MGNNFSSSIASGSLTPSPATVDGLGPQRIPLVDELQLRQLYASSPQAGTPRYAAVRPLAQADGADQRWEAIFYPIPNDDLTLEYRYAIAPGPVSEDGWPMGGKQHAETILASCLAVAEMREFKGEGVCHANWMRRLAASVKLDVDGNRITEDGVWPLDEPQDGLAISRRYLTRSVGTLLGFGPNPKTWTHKQQEEALEVMRSGLRKFYLPPPLPGERNSHKWSFLRPITAITTVSGVTTYDLPADFASLSGPLTYAAGSSSLYPSVQIVSEVAIRKREQHTDTARRPEIAAIRVKQPSDGQTRYEIKFWPEPDGAYSLYYRYQINPESLPDDAAIPHGGSAHAQTVLEAVLASAEERLGKLGVHSKRFVECLVASVSHDRQQAAPETLGYNRDKSDTPSVYNTLPDLHACDDNLVGYNGVYY